MAIRYSILDQSVAVRSKPQGQAIRDTLALSEFVEDLGYDHFWVSEHHNHPTIMGSAPEVLMGAIATQTKRIRIGSAGIMLPHYSPFKVAEQFRVLDALAPGRIDLGLGRAPGSDGRTAFALNPNANERPHAFPADVRDLSAWVAGEPLMDGHPFRSVQAFPGGETKPEIWMLGSSDYGAQVAALFGLPYAFAWFFTDGQGAERALSIYREHYRPSERWPEPHSAICVWALAGDELVRRALGVGVARIRTRDHEHRLHHARRLDRSRQCALRRDARVAYGQPSVHPHRQAAGLPRRVDAGAGTPAARGRQLPQGALPWG